jgi:two-component system, OmpR family, phosphate regulon sensor histidine kinase PhoR
MPKLHNFFLYNFLGIYAATLLIISVIGYFTLKTILIDQVKYELRLSLDFTSMLLPHMNNLDNFADHIHDISQDRVTIINNKGVVLAESNFDKHKMSNHLNRPEIIQAKALKFGSSLRESKTLHNKFLYLAKYLKYKDSSIYIRISKNITVLYGQFYKMYLKILAIFLLFAIIGLIATYKMNKKVRYDIDQITDYLNHISNKNYKAIIKTKYFNEFLYISILLKNLVKKLANREKKKNKYNAKLRLINKQRSDMLSAISHEFKNPIAAITGYAQTIRDDENININIKNRFLDKILSNADKISAMIDRLALSIKLENNNLSLSATRFDIYDLCVDVKNVLSMKYKERNIILDVDHFMVTADKTMLELVVTNLLDNALKYSQDDVKLSLVGSTLYVQDRGIGFEESQIQKITAKFYRVKANSWDNSMGLGLAIVSYILKLHNIELIIQSTPNIGSSFGFDLQSLTDG